MDLNHLAEQIEGSALGQAIRESTWLFPAIEATHLLAIAALGGAVFILAFSVLGVGLKTPAVEIEKTTRPYMNWSVILLLLTGVLLGASEPVKLINREAFAVKMIGLLGALLFSYLIFNPLVRRGNTGAVTRLSALIVIGLWLTVAISGRWIGFS